MMNSIRRLAACCLALVCLAGVAMAASTRYYDNTVEGTLNPPEPGITSPLYLRLAVSGDTPGALTSVLDYNNSGDIVGGTWTLTTPAVEGETTSALSGRFTAGTVTRLEDGTPDTVSGATLEVTRGTGAYADVTAGDGTFEGTVGGEAFLGRLTLTF